MNLNDFTKYLLLIDESVAVLHEDTFYQHFNLISRQQTFLFNLGTVNAVHWY